MEMNLKETPPLPPLIPEIVAVTEHLIEEMIAFGKSTYPPGDPNLDVAYLRWLCIQNPCGSALAIVIREHGCLVGQAIMVPVDLAAGSSASRGYFVVNVLTHPEFRNRRLFSTIIDAAKEFVSGRQEWLLGHPNAAALPGWKRKEMTFRTPLVPHLSGLCFGISQRIEIIDTEPALMRVWPDIDACVGSNGGRHVRLLRTLDYMLWRFMRRPDKHYRLGLCRGKDDSLLGFFVATRWKHHLDLIVDHGSCNARGAKVRVDRPAIVMLPRERERVIPSHIASSRLPIRKIMPFFATTFFPDDLCFDDITLASSDF